ncbi:citrate/2-methylcitrate synthase [Pendulispora brunnea]|uniref:citrate synthase (unknown stereospecificity) n=1 Tax=Pendulispora brunnea TaxID=2905690 RepID=A0ABZ2K708_9BACT
MMNEPHNLLGRPATRYRGTDIDGPTLAPEGLWVRGRNLNDLIGQTDFESALWHIWFEGMPSAAERDAVRARLAAFGRAFEARDASVDAAALVGGMGIDMVSAAATGFLRGIDGVRAKSGTSAWDDDFDQMLACIAGAPYLMRAALGPAIERLEPATSHAERVLRLCAEGGAPSKAGIAIMDALLIAWHAGFGYITPTVLVPRCAIGTGVTLAQAIAAGFMSSGPNHVGAAFEAMRWLTALAAREGNGTDEAIAAVDAVIDQPGALLFGFGHPLFVADPRPPHLRALCTGLGFEGKHLHLFDAACARARERKGLNPNIDFITAAALLDLGVREARWGVGVGLCARIAAMAAHAVERRRRPAFGVNSSTARKLLAAVPVGWL